MRYNVSQLLKEFTGSTRHFDIDEGLPSPEPDWGDELQVVGSVDMVRTQRGILVSAHVRTAIGEVCSRCLEPLTEQLDLEIEAEFFPTIDVWSGSKVVVPNEVEGFTIDQRHVLDLTEAFRQCAWVTKELRPLCTPECKGLCTECGANLNVGQCACEAPLDPRWDRLRRRSA